MGDGRFVSADGKRHVRMTDSDLAELGNHAGAPHLNFEHLKPNPNIFGGLKIMRELIFNYLKNNKYIKYNKESRAFNKLEIDKNLNVVLSGNQLGLIMLADYLVEIALSEDNNNHIHLDVENFFDEAEIELILSKSNDL